MCHGLSPSFLTQSAVCVQHTGGSQVLGVYVGLVVLRQMVAPHEAFLTLAALKALVSCEEKHGEEKSVGVLKKTSAIARAFQETDLCASWRVAEARRCV